MAVRNFAAVGTAARGAHAQGLPTARGGVCGGVSAGGHHRWVTFFNTVVLTYYTHIFDELDK